MSTYSQSIATNGWPSGLAGSISIKVYSGSTAGAVRIAQTTAGITEIAAGEYEYAATLDTAWGNLYVVWSYLTYSAEAELDNPATSSTPGGLLTVMDARSRVRSLARNAGDSSVYSDTDIDYAIQHILEDFVGFTRCIKQTDTLQLDIGTSKLDGSTISDFRPQWIVKLWIAGKDQIQLVDHGSVMQQMYDTPTTGAPRLVGFSDWMTADVWPTADATYQISVLWTPPATFWTAGSDDAVQLNVPTDLLLPILTYGATAVLQHTETKQRYASASWAKYEAFRNRQRNAGSIAGQVSISGPMI